MLDFSPPERPGSPSQARPTAIDLFAGAGGLSLGLEQSGFDVLASVEYDPVHATTHAFNFPMTEVLCDDMSTLQPETIVEAARKGWAAHGGCENWDGDVDLIAGGPPCQGFSFIGKRDVSDPRNSLIVHFFRVIQAIRPKYFIMENVPGIASGNHRSLLIDLIRLFQENGYTITSPQILNAADFGVPQDRRRFVLLGTRDGLPRLVYPNPKYKPVREVRSSLAFSGLPYGPTVWDAIGDIPNLDEFDELLEHDQVHLSRSQLAISELARSEYGARLAGANDPADYSYSRVWCRELLTSSARTVHTQKSIDRFNATPQGHVEPISRFLRLAEDGLCNTLRAGTGGDHGAFTSPRPIHPRLPRVISVREAARLHSFPDWFRLHATKWNGFRQIGNSVPPLLGRALGSSVVDALGLTPVKPECDWELGDVSLLHLAMGEAASVAGATHTTMPLSRRISYQQRAGLG